MEPITIRMTLESGATISSNDDTYFLVGASSTADVASFTPSEWYVDAFLRPTLVFPDMGTGVFHNRLFGITLVNDSGSPLRFCLMMARKWTWRMVKPIPTFRPLQGMR